MTKKLIFLTSVATFTACSSSLDQGAIAVEIETNVNEIRQAQLDLLVVGDFRACGSAEEARAQASTTPREWKTQKCWTKIGWAPSAPVAGGYWVEVSGEDFTVHGIGPKEPGGPIHMIATKDNPAAPAK